VPTTWPINWAARLIALGIGTCRCTTSSLSLEFARSSRKRCRPTFSLISFVHSRSLALFVSGSTLRPARSSGTSAPDLSGRLAGMCMRRARRVGRPATARGRSESRRGMPLIQSGRLRISACKWRNKTLRYQLRSVSGAAKAPLVVNYQSALADRPAGGRRAQLRPVADGSLRHTAAPRNSIKQNACFSQMEISASSLAA
jgi:hypothetical protein